MPNRGDRGGSLTRARIAEVATRLFLERGFDQVTIAEVAAASGVSKVTVFSHFERKEDLLLDRLPDAVDLVRDIVRSRAPDVDVVEAFRRTALDLARQHHALSGLAVGEVEPFLNTVLSAPTLVARLRESEYEIETALAAELDSDPRFSGDSDLTAALLLAAYRTVLSASIRARLAGTDLDAVATAHRSGLGEAFDAVAHGLSADTSFRPPRR